MQGKLDANISDDGDTIEWYTWTYYKEHEGSPNARETMVTVLNPVLPLMFDTFRRCVCARGRGACMLQDVVAGPHTPGRDASSARRDGAVAIPTPLKPPRQCHPLVRRQ